MFCMYMIYWDLRLCTCALKYFSQVRIYIIWTNRFCALLCTRTFQKNIERECKSALLGAAKASKTALFGHFWALLHTLFYKRSVGGTL